MRNKNLLKEPDTQGYIESMLKQGEGKWYMAGNVDRIAQMSVENSRAVEESAHTAHSLRDLASRMDLAVAHFKLS
ncbi:hypothetical protein ACFQNF_07765 [Iodobacter arcticus]|uniref:Methyl-accepting chemotaxis protein n=1 Tax=Iodobacter arcticus TaxID=590593 RepID=A0ABW2QVM5_9NEIS